MLILSNTRKLIFSIILAVSLLAVGALSFLIIEMTKEEGREICISYNGETVARYSLATDGEYPILDGKNVIVIEDGAAYMKSADCPDKLCIHQGKISRTRERIVCLPNRIIVEVIGDGDEMFIN